MSAVLLALWMIFKWAMFVIGVAFVSVLGLALLVDACVRNQYRGRASYHPDVARES